MISRSEINKMLLIKVRLIGENTSGRNSNSFYALNVFVTKKLQQELPIICYGNISYDTAATTNPSDLGFIDTLCCLKLCVPCCKRR